jgi:O-methyltransferase
MKNSIINRTNKIASQSLAKLGYSVKIRKLNDYRFSGFVDGEFRGFHELCRSYTSIPWEALHINYQAAKWVTGQNIPGDIVECGVFKGGSMLMMAKTVQAAEDKTYRRFWLYDTYEGMSEPSEHDVSLLGATAHDKYRASLREDGTSNWNRADLESVQALFAANAAGLPVVFVKGKVEDTLVDTENIPKAISILRLDTDFYESTKTELEVLYPLLSDSGVLIIDDYYHWHGARQAIDEYFASNGIRPTFVTDPQSGRVVHFKRA